MPRLVELDATGPLKLDPEDVDPEKGDVAVCRCGLSGSFPFCDGSHRETRDEDGEELYVYERPEDVDGRGDEASADERAESSGARRLRRRRVERVVLADEPSAERESSTDGSSDGEC